MAVFEITCMKCGVVGRYTSDHPLKAESLWGEEHLPVCAAFQARVAEYLNDMNLKIRAEFIQLRKVG